MRINCILEKNALSVLRVKKRVAIASCFVFCAIFAGIAAFVPSTSSVNKTVITATVIIARLLAVGAMSFLTLFVVELYPTAIRNIGTSLVFGFSRLAVAILPLVFLVHQVRHHRL